jgi:hypothetical protein
MVKVIRLSDYWREHIKEDVEILKINIEGMEWDVMEDLIRADILNRFKNIWIQDHGVRGEKIMPACRDKALEIFPLLKRLFRGQFRFIDGTSQLTGTVPGYLT